MVERIRPYAAIFEPTGGGGYGIFFPEVPGCFSAGDSMSHAALMAREALSLHLAFAAGDEILSLENINLDAELAECENGARVVFVEPDFFIMSRHIPAKAQRVNITIDANLLHYADQKAKQFHINRSQLIAEALREYMGDEERLNSALK